MDRKSSRAVDPAQRELVLIRVFDAPRELVWEAWTDPKHVAKWWGPKGFTNPVCDVDPRPGGAIRIHMRGPDGTVHPMTGVYREIVEPERIVMAGSALDKDGNPILEVLNTMTFAEHDGKTTLTVRARVVTMTAEGAPHLEGMEAGWTQSLQRLADHLAKAPVVVERVFNAPSEVVWTAITDRDQMKAWYFEELNSFKPEVGFQTQFNVRLGDKDYLHQWTVMDVVPGRRIAYVWRYGGYPGESLVTFELAAEGDRTRLTLTHEGLETFLPETHPELARGNFVKGWTGLVGTSLGQFVENRVDGAGPQGELGPAGGVSGEGLS